MKTPMYLAQFIRDFFGGSQIRRRNRPQISDAAISRYESLEDRCLLAATQVITPANTSIVTSGDSTVAFDVQYSARDAESNSAPAALLVRMHYNSPELTPDVAAIRSSAQIFNNFTLEVSDNPERSFNQTDLVGTDRYISLVWRTSGGTPAFPGDNSTLPLTLFKATFSTSSSFDGETIPFTSNLTLAVGNEVVGFESTPTVLTLATNVAPVITSAATTTTAENQIDVHTATAVDDDNDALTYAISGGADATLFNIVAATGFVSFKTAPDYEAPADAGANNVYNIQVTANDGTVNSAPQNVAITVTDVQDTNRNPTMGAIAPVSFQENQTTAVLTVSASDPDLSDTLIYSLTGTDAALFSISATGAVTFNAAPDFEAPGDNGANNIYNITANVNDGNGGATSQNAVITVTDVDETPDQTTGTIQGRKFNDLNGDGTRDSGEGWLNGWTIQLVDSTGSVVASQVTANRGTEAGWYSFTTAPGSYTLQEVAQDGYLQTAPVNGLAVSAANLDSALDLQDTGNAFSNWGGLNERWVQSNTGWHFITPDGTLHKWDNSPRTNLTGTVVSNLSSAYYANTALLTEATAVQTPVYTVVAGQRLPDVNFGNFDTTQTGSIQGRLWNDLNGDGTRDSNEPWANGWTVELIEGPGSVSQTTFTADIDLNNDGQINAETETGWYQFSDVSAGDWIVRQEDRNGWEPTAPGAPSTLEAFELNAGKDFRFNRSLYANWGGLNERWIHSDDGWHYITPNGQLFKWDGSGRSSLTGDLVTELSPDIHADPALLYNALSPHEAAVQLAAGESVQNINFGNQQDADNGGGGSSSFAGVGNVAARIRGNDLILTGDGASNGVIVYTNSDGLITVDGLGNTTIQGQSEPWVVQSWTSIPGSLIGNFHDGGDALVIQDVSLGATVWVNMHAGDDYMLMDNVTTGARFDFRSNWGDNTIVVANSSIGMLARVITGLGNDVLHVDNARVGGPTIVRSWQGNDDFLATRSTFGGVFAINSGSGNDEMLLLEGNTFQSTVTIDGWAGTDAVSAEGSSDFSRTPIILRVEQDSIAGPDALLDSLMGRLADVGLDGLLA